MPLVTVLTDVDGLVAKKQEAPLSATEDRGICKSQDVASPQMATSHRGTHVV